MIQAKIVNKINFPDITLLDDLEYVAKNIIITDMIVGIDTSTAIVGGMLPDNEPSTKLYKARKGLGDRPLVATGELRSSFQSRVTGSNRVVISIRGDRSKIGKTLQDGIKTKSGLKQYMFFGISKDAYDGAMRYMRKRLKEITSGKGK